MAKKVVFGLKPSVLDGSEHVFEPGKKSMGIPDKYSYEKILPPILDQGDKPYCVPYSVSAFLAWRQNMKDNIFPPVNVGLDFYEVYNSKEIEDEGMTFKEAFTYLRHHGANSDFGVQKIGEYAMIKSLQHLKYALIMNGPCLGALPVYGSNEEFWDSRGGRRLLGFHAICIAGYDEEGFIIRNSWGESYGKHGYGKLKYEDFTKLMELWTVIY